MPLRRVPRNPILPSCLITTGIYPPDVGGPATYVPRLAAALSERGWTGAIVAVSAATEPDPGDPPAFRVIRIARAQFLPRRKAALVRAIAAEARRAQVVFSAGALTEAVLGNAVARRPMVAKIVGDAVWERASRRGWTALDLDPFQTAPAGTNVRIVRAMRAWSLRRVDRIIAPSAYTARLVDGWTAQRPSATIIYNAAPEVRVDAETDPLPHLPHPRLVMAGRLIPLKRIDGVIRALREIPGATLVVIGGGDEEAPLRALAASEGVAGRVVFTGSLPSHEVLRVLRHADLLVLNSSTENCPHVVLEALAVGLPVIATRVGGVPELVKDGLTGRLIDSANPPELVARLQETLADPDWRRRASAAASTAAASFSWRAHADTVDQLLREIAQTT